MFILDTNVLSEVMDPEGAAEVATWIDPIRKTDLFITALNQAEILYGIAVMPSGRKRNQLIEWADAMFAEDFRGRILPFDERAAGHFADIAATRARSGRRVEPIDAQIAGIARAHGMTVVTRNVKDFEDCSIDVIDPWSP
jgi:predicted nucleic acid-binding protein